jgi:ABC-2 type transport system permease protein
MWIYIKHELKYWLSSPMIWIFLVINTLLILGAVSSEAVKVGEGTGSVHKNAPYVIQSYYGLMSLICLLMTTAFMNATANRDFHFNMYQLVFSSPVKKRDYYFGKFIGAAIISVVPLLGVSLGSLIGPLMPWIEPQRYGSVVWSGHLWGLISLGIPNIFIVGVMLFNLAMIFRSNTVSFIGAILILVLYAISSGFTEDIEKEWLASILDPFGFRPLSILSKYLTVDEKNAHAVALTSVFLLNRLIWVSISLAILIVTYFKFSFSIKNVKVKKEKKKKTKGITQNVANIDFKPTLANRFSFKTLWFLTKFETKSIIKNPVFIIIVVIGLLNFIANLTSLTGRYGTDQYLVTYHVIDSIRSAFYLFIIGIITFYSGVLVWKDRDYKIHEIQDSTPVKTVLLFTSKVIALFASIELLIVLSIITGMIVQTLSGYTHYQIDVYVKSLLVLDFLSFSYLVVIALFFHYVINNRYIAYFAFVAFIILNQFIWALFETNSNMLIFGGTPSVTYSDMNGFGPFVPSLIWFNIYWSLACVIICIVVFAFYLRGKETGFKQRLGNAYTLIGKSRIYLAGMVLIFLLCSGFVFYNINVLNTYDSPKEAENKQVDYEKTYKKYQYLLQPRYYKFNYVIDVAPYHRNMEVHIDAWAKNISAQVISELHFTLPKTFDSLVLSIKNSKLKLRDNRLNYRIYCLDKPLNPGDSVLISTDMLKITKGFENEVSFKQLTQNGTFFNSTDVLPCLGYNPDIEITDKNKRVKHKLPKRDRLPRLNENDLNARKDPYVKSNADWVELTTTISTAPDQIAVAPGSLLKTWKKNGRKYFIYQLDHKSLNFYSFISARYEVSLKKWNGINIEVYYSKQHGYNVTNMLKSLEKSLEYYTKNFGSYYHKQARIIEFPRYEKFAQAFPGTIPYSESIGFITDLRKVTKDDIDAVFYVVAHEMAHQYWAHQMIGANMQGSELMSESFAQYSALMVMEKEYGKDKMKKFLKYEMDGYLRGRSTEYEAERPLMRTESQGYIHYQKGSVVMYYLKEMIGEKKLNQALHSLIDSFAYKQPPYPTSWSAIRAFRKVTPDSLQYLISDLFENITLFSNRMLEANYKKKGNKYEVTLKTTSEKFIADTLGKETSVPIADYIDIGIFGASKSKNNPGKVLVLKRLKINKKESTFTFITDEKPFQAGIDPYNYLIDRMPDDNLKTIEEKK